MTRRIGLVGCVKEKAREARPARDLYTSTLFLGRRRYVERTCDSWWILSAEHGLVDPHDVLAPYDTTLKTMGRPERRAWSARVFRALDAKVCLAAEDTIEVHAGADYLDYGLSDEIRRRGCTIVNPTANMRIGHQLAFYKAAHRG